MIPPILMYHRIGDAPGDKNTVSPGRFELQLQYLEDHGFCTLGLTEWYQMLEQGEKVPEKAVILTFDDGYLDNWELAMPLLLRYKMKATVFMVASLVGKTNEWEKNAFRQGVPMMGAEHLREWCRAGLEVGSHGVNHRRLVGLSREELQMELTESKKMLEEVTGASVDFFCYPHGDFDQPVAEAIRQAGYLGSVAIYDGASWRKPIEWFALPRLRVTDGDEPGIFRWKVSKYHSWMGRARLWEKIVKKWWR